MAGWELELKDGTLLTGSGEESELEAQAIGDFYEKTGQLPAGVVIGGDPRGGVLSTLYDVLVPSDAKGWAILGASTLAGLAAGAGTGGVGAAPAALGTRAALIAALKVGPKAAAAIVGRSATSRIASTTVAGGVAGGVEKGIKEGKPGEGVSEGLFQGFVSSAGGEAGAAVLNKAYQIGLQRWISTTINEARLTKFLKNFELFKKAGIGEKELKKVIVHEGTEEIAEQMFKEGYRDVLKLQTQSKLGMHLRSRAFDEARERLGMVSSSRVGLTVADALDTLSNLGRLAYDKGLPKGTMAAQQLQGLRNQLFVDLEGVLSPAAYEKLSSTVSTHAVNMELLRILKTDSTQVFKANGDIDFGVLQKSLDERLAKFGPAVRKKLGGTLDRYADMIYRGPSRAQRDVSGHMGSFGVSPGRAPAFFGLPRPPRFVGDVNIPSAVGQLPGAVGTQELSREPSQ